MKKRMKAAPKKSLIHAAFPPQGTPQTAAMGSQSATPNLEMQLAGPQAPAMPVDSATPMQASGEY